MLSAKRKITYRLYLTKKQDLAMWLVLRLHQQLYNAALEQRISAYKKQKKSLSYVAQARDLTLLRAEMDHSIATLAGAIRLMVMAGNYCQAKKTDMVIFV